MDAFHSEAESYARDPRWRTRSSGCPRPPAFAALRALFFRIFNWLEQGTGRSEREILPSGGGTTPTNEYVGVMGFASMAVPSYYSLCDRKPRGAPGWGAHHLLKRFVGRSTQIPLPLPEHFPLLLCPTSYRLSRSSLVAHSGAIGAAFHVTDPTPPTAAEVLLNLGGMLPEEENPWTDRLSSWINQLPGVSPPPGAIQGYISKEVWFELGSTRATMEGVCPLCPPFALYSDELGQALGTLGPTP